MGYTQEEHTEGLISCVSFIWGLLLYVQEAWQGACCYKSLVSGTLTFRQCTLGLIGRQGTIHTSGVLWIKGLISPRSLFPAVLQRWFFKMLEGFKNIISKLNLFYINPNLKTDSYRIMILPLTFLYELSLLNFLSKWERICNSCRNTMACLCLGEKI